MRRTVVLTVLAVLAVLLALPASAQEERLARAQALLDDGRPTAAIEALGPLIDRNDARALLLRSTAHFMEGRRDQGRADLDRALELAPDLRQAWLNRAGLDIAEGDYERALEALERARALDPAAPDSHLNIGAVLLLQGHVADATESFERYVAASGESGEAHYLVATNYAGRGYARAAVEHLAGAIARDETFRLRARTDTNFAGIAEAPELQALMETDGYVPGPRDHQVRRSFPVRYAGGEGQLLSAVLEAMRAAGEPFDPRVETASAWGLVHGELRVKLHDERAEDGAVGVVSLSAPADRLSESAWRGRVDRLFETLERILLRRQRIPAPPEPDRPPADPTR